MVSVQRMQFTGFWVFPTSLLQRKIVSVSSQSSASKMSLKLAAIFFCIPKEPLIMKRYQISISFNFGFTPDIEGE